MFLKNPIIIENSRLPRWLSKISPIEVEAFSFGPFVVSRGEITDRVKRHETIHYRQQLELLFVFQWILYLLFYVLGRIRYGDWTSAYYKNPFELEAYEYDTKEDYLENRKLWSWAKYLGVLI